MSLKFFLTNLWKNARFALRSYNQKLLTRILPATLRSAPGAGAGKHVVSINHRYDGRFNKFAAWFHETVYNCSRRPATLQLAQMSRTPTVYGFLGGLTITTQQANTSSNRPFTASLCDRVREIFESYAPPVTDDDDEDVVPKSLDEIEFGDVIAKGCNAVVYEGRLKKHQDDNKGSVVGSPSESVSRGAGDKLLAIKVMFNYGVESNADSIRRAMASEIVPATLGRRCNRGLHLDQVHGHGSRVHPNIIDIKCVLTERMPLLPEAWSLYPDALPTVYNSNGLGRSMTLFIIMDRYDMNLREYLASSRHSSGGGDGPEVGLTSRLVLSAQLLEGVAYLTSQGLAHRDIKSDNILINLPPTSSSSSSPHGRGQYMYPQLVISDFGCCVQQSPSGHGSDSILVPYYTDHICKGGNYLLMAPEIVSCVAGENVHLDYSKSDLWSAATIIYEIFTSSNPFYTHLANDTYTDSDLPDIIDTTSHSHSADDVRILHCLSCVVKLMMSRDVNQRISAYVSANLLHLLLLQHLSPPRRHDPVVPVSHADLHPDLDLPDERLMMILCEVWTRFIGTPCHTLANLHHSFITRLHYTHLITACVLLRNITSHSSSSLPHH